MTPEVSEKINNPFRDVNEKDYFFNPVIWGLQEGITKGTSEDTFSPKEPCTRGQVITFLWRAAGCPRPTLTENPFDDVSEDAYYYQAILWAYEQGITKGADDGSCHPDDAVTRAESVTFLYRFKGSEPEGEMPYNDVSEKDYYYPAVLWAYEDGVTLGTEEGAFSPDDVCLREQIITFLYRVYHR